MGKSQTKAKNKYNAKAYDRISVTVKKGMKDEWKSEADKQGLSLNAFIEQAVNQMIGNISQEEYDTLLFLTVEELDFTVRTLNTIKRVGINTIGDFCEFTKNHKLCKIRNCYKHNALEIINKIKEYDNKYKASLDIDYDNLMEQIETLPDYNKHK